MTVKHLWTGEVVHVVPIEMSVNLVLRGHGPDKSADSMQFQLTGWTKRWTVLTFTFKHQKWYREEMARIGHGAYCKRIHYGDHTSDYPNNLVQNTLLCLRCVTDFYWQRMTFVSIGATPR